MTTTLRSEGLCKDQARRVSLLKKSYLEARKKFAADMLKKMIHISVKLCGQMKQKLSYLAIVIIRRFGVNQVPRTIGTHSS